MKWLIPAVIFAYYTELADTYHLAKYCVLAFGAAIFLWERKILRTDLDEPIWIYIGSTVLSSILAYDPLVCFLGLANFYFNGVFPLLVCTLLYYAAVYEDPDELINWFIYSVAVCCLIGIAQWYGFLAPFPLPAWDRVYSTIGSPVFLSGIIAMAIPLVIYRANLLLLIPMVPCLLMTQTRAGLFGAIIGSAAALVLRYKLSAKSLALWVGAPVLLAAAMIFVGAARPSTKQSDKGRTWMYKMAWQAFKDHPLVGYGPENYMWAFQEYRTTQLDHEMRKNYSNSYAHNLFLQALATTGFIGFLALLFLLFTLGWTLYFHPNQGVFAAAIGLFVYSLFQPAPLHAKAILAMLVGSLMPYGTRD